MAEKFDPNFHYKIKFSTVFDSIKWFKNLVIELRGKKSRELSKEDKERKEQLLTDKQLITYKFEIGKMYLFYYDPKGKDTLPYYDTFPLVLITGFTRNEFTGINLHYLPVEHRMVLLSNLMQKAVYKEGKFDRLNIKYDNLQGIQEFGLFEPCFKKYLFSRVRSQIRLIPAEDWGFAASLPLEIFKKEIKQQVWKESLATQNMVI